MNTLLAHRSSQVLFALLLAGCSSSESAQTVELAVPQTDVASPASVPPSDPAAPATAVAQPATATSTLPPTSAASTPLPPTPNQANQATLARQWETTLTATGPEPVDASTATKPVTPATPHAATGNTHVKPFRPAGVAVNTQATRHHPLSGSQRHAAQVAQATMAPVAQSPASIRKTRFTALVSRLHSPVAVRQVELPSAPRTTMMLKLGNVGISNFNETTDVYFALKTSLQDWRDEHLAPGSTREFPCSLGADEACVFSMQTGEQAPVRYPLHQGDRYAIVWDSQNGIWDLRLARQDSEEN